MKQLVLTVLFLFCFLPLNLIANSYQSKLGTFDFEHYRIQGGLGGASYSKAQFSTFGTYLGLSWQLIPNYVGYFELGDLQYQKGFVWSGVADVLDFGIRRAYLEYQTHAIAYRLGLLGNAFDSFTTKSFYSNQIPNQAYEINLWRKQNVGFEFFCTYQSWASQLQLYRSRDEKAALESSPWVSGSFQYVPQKSLGVSLSAIAGEVRMVDIVLNQLNQIGLNRIQQEDSKIRIGKIAIFENQGKKGSQYLLEWAKGEMKQHSVTQHFSWTTFDVRQRLNQDFSFYLRYDSWIPDITNHQSYSNRYDLGFILFGEQNVNQWLFLVRETISPLPSHSGMMHREREFWLNLVVSSY